MSPVVVVVIGLGVLLALVLVGTPVFFNRLSPAVDSRRRAKDDDYFFNECASGRLSQYRRLNRRMPSDPRCRLCLAPFAGLGRVLRIQRSRKNPNYCMGCFEMAPLGATDREIGVMFVDLRGFTQWCEDQPPEAVEQALNHFYAVTTSTIAAADGLVDKLVGDEVMGLFLPDFPSLADRTCEVMLEVSEAIVERLRVARDGMDGLPVGIGLHFGLARVGNLGVGEVKDFTAVGDVVNTAARLQGAAGPGEILLSEAVASLVEDRGDALTPVALELKGKAEPVAARVLRCGVADSI